MRIVFDYRNADGKCLMKDFGGCCCECLYSFEVKKHCKHSRSDEPKCVCNDSLGFHVCIAKHVELGDYAVRLSSEHGICERFIDRRCCDAEDCWVGRT